MQCHDFAAMRSGLQQRGIVNLLAEASALVKWRDSELAKRPRTGLAQKFDFGGWVWPGQRDGSDYRATELTNEADPARNAFLGVGDRLVSCPIAQAVCGVRRVRIVNELG
jgi:hypothetical protein